MAPCCSKMGQVGSKFPNLRLNRPNLDPTWPLLDPMLEPCWRYVGHFGSSKVLQIGHAAREPSGLQSVALGAKKWPTRGARVSFSTTAPEKHKPMEKF